MHCLCISALTVLLMCVQVEEDHANWHAQHVAHKQLLGSQLASAKVMSIL